MKKESSVKVGNRYGKLVVTDILPVLKKVYPAGYTAYKYPVRCKCDCGNNNFVTTKQELSSGSTTTCGCRVYNKLKIGDRFGRLVITSGPVRDKKVTKWLCKCDCGGEVLVADYSLKSGNTKSCGCSNRVYPDVIPGEKYGKLTVIQLHKDERGMFGKFWDCECDCGNKTVVSDSKLKRGETKSCGCLVKKHYIKSGDKFGYWTVIKDLGSGFYECRCKCGTIRTVTSHVLRSGSSTSCGCKYTDPRNNDDEITKFLPVAANILRRTHEVTNYLFHSYGGRGITCELGETRYDVAESLKRVPGYSKGLQIDRVDNDGNYTLHHPEYGDNVWIYYDNQWNKTFKVLGNLRWVTPEENSFNKHDIGNYVMKVEDFSLRLMYRNYFKRLIRKNKLNENEFVEFDCDFLSEYDVRPELKLYVHKTLTERVAEFKSRIKKFYEVNKDWKTITIKDDKINKGLL